MMCEVFVPHHPVNLSLCHSWGFYVFAVPLSFWQSPSLICYLSHCLLWLLLLLETTGLCLRLRPDNCFYVTTVGYFSLVLGYSPALFISPFGGIPYFSFVPPFDLGQI